MGWVQDSNRSDDYDRLLPPEGLRQEFPDNARVMVAAGRYYPDEPGTVIEMAEDGAYLIELDAKEDGEHVEEWHLVRDLVGYSFERPEEAE